jgi:hypothetical protein
MLNYAIIQHHQPTPCGQITIGEEVPAVLTPAKPKFLFLGTVSIPAKSAVLLK